MTMEASWGTVRQSMEGVENVKGNEVVACFRELRF